MARTKPFDEPPGLAQSLRLFEHAMQYREIVGKLLKELIGARGLVQARSIQELHNRLCSSDYGFVFRRITDKGVLEGGRQLFYNNGPILVRVKTRGTKFRSNHYMTISLADGLEWPEEVGKFDHNGVLVPRVSPVKRAADEGLWRSLDRLEEETDGTMAESDDRWANACHFNFAPGFDTSGIEALMPNRE